MYIAVSKRYCLDFEFFDDALDWAWRNDGAMLWFLTEFDRWVGGTIRRF